MRSAEEAAIAGWLFSPARLLPETDDLVHVYRYRHASAGQVAELRAAYHHAISATERVTAALDTLLTDLCTPGDPYALARALQRSPVAASPHLKATPLSPQTGQLGPGAGDVERLLHSLKVSDPQLLFRAIALDHATRDLTAEALAKAEQLARFTEDAWPAPGCHSKDPRNQSARLAAQDRPSAASLALPGRDPIGPAKPRSARRVPGDQPSARKPMPMSSTR